jgi:hypothetical protein
MITDIVAYTRCMFRVVLYRVVALVQPVVRVVRIWRKETLLRSDRHYQDYIGRCAGGAGSVYTA